MRRNLSVTWLMRPLAKIDGRLEIVESLANSLLEILHMETLTDAQMDEYLHNLVYKLPEIESITMAYDPNKPSIHRTRSIYHKNNQLVIQKPSLSQTINFWIGFSCQV